MWERQCEITHLQKSVTHTHTEVAAQPPHPPTPQLHHHLCSRHQNKMSCVRIALWFDCHSLLFPPLLLFFFKFRMLQSLRNWLWFFFFFFFFAAARNGARLADKLQASETKNQMCEIWRLLELIRSALRRSTDREIVFAYLNVNWKWTNAVIFPT